VTGTNFTFPIGYHEFHKDQLYNFQLNRWHSLGYARFEDMKAAGGSINDFRDWKREMVRLAETAVSEGRLMNAAFYWRAAEFYAFQDDPDKALFYDKFSELFNMAFQADGIERHSVPYGDKFLPAIRVLPGGEAQGSGTGGVAAARGSGKSGTIVMHGGFDSFIEEFYSWMRFFSERGYEVIAFEGPGQGAARKRDGLALDYRWEKPVGAVLDHFRLDDVTLLGISMGGWLCFRAAAFEPRIARVIASGIAYDYMQFINVVLQKIMMFFFRYLRGFSNWSTYRKMKADEMHAWIVGNLMYITRAKTPMDAFDVVSELNARNLHSELVKQDVLMLTGREDHFIPFKMHDMQLKALTNAKSVTARVFTREEDAHNHCQIGNLGLALDMITGWLEEVKPTKGEF